ncbi:MAG: PTS sugar transporter subunit IIA [Brevinematales bacterium]|nr:PTS sugar transporter subunit IIA [Brevinematales bacterium]
MVTISEIIQKECVLFIDGGNREEVIKTLVQSAYKCGKIPSEEAFEKAVLERERVLGTGIGVGVAVPHAKLEGVKDFFIMVGILRKDTDWDSIDRVPVRIVFLIGCPLERQREYLEILATVTLLVKSKSRRVRLLESSAGESVIECFKGL